MTTGDSNITTNAINGAVTLFSRRTQRKLRIGMSFLIIALGLAAAQTVQKSAPVPDAVLYNMTFRRIVGQKQFADKLDAQGKNGSVVRSDLRKQMGISQQDYATLESTAAAFVSAHTANLIQLKQLHEQLKNNPSDATLRQQATSIRQQDHALINAQVGNLKAALGPTTFQRVDAWARANVLPHINYQGN